MWYQRGRRPNWKVHTGKKNKKPLDRSLKTSDIFLSLILLLEFISGGRTLIIHLLSPIMTYQWPCYGLSQDLHGWVTNRYSMGRKKRLCQDYKKIYIYIYIQNGTRIKMDQCLKNFWSSWGLRYHLIGLGAPILDNLVGGPTGGWRLNVNFKDNFMNCGYFLDFFHFLNVWWAKKSVPKIYQNFQKNGMLKFELYRYRHRIFFCNPFLW